MHLGNILLSIGIGTWTLCSLVISIPCVSAPKSDRSWKVCLCSFTISANLMASTAPGTSVAPPVDVEGPLVPPPALCCCRCWWGQCYDCHCDHSWSITWQKDVRPCLNWVPIIKNAFLPCMCILSCQVIVLIHFKGCLVYWTVMWIRQNCNWK